MKRILLKVTLVLTIISCAVISCDQDKTDPEVPEYYVNGDYVIPDSLLNDITRRLLNEFKNDNSITCKRAYCSEFMRIEDKVITLVGIRDKHLYCKLLAAKDGTVITEYQSSDTIIESYTLDKGYGEKEEIEFIYDKVEWGLDYYLKDSNSETFIWWFPRAMKFEFKSSSSFKSFYDFSPDYSITWGYNSFFYKDICYNCAGDTLYELSSYGKIRLEHIKNGDSRNAVFVSDEDIVMIDYDGELIEIEKHNLKNNDYFVWKLQKNTENNLSDDVHGVKTEYNITQKEGSQWEFQIMAISYEGTKVKITFVLDIGNPPAELTITEEIL